ncbi:MAG: patatin-like phospholipase family protein [Xanthobacteraceae bacterium]
MATEQQSQPTQKTAFVFAGGGSLGAVQVGMLRELTREGLTPDFVVGSSVGAINATYFAAAPNAAGVRKLEEIWLGLQRRDVFPVSLRSVLGLIGGSDHIIDPANLRALIERHIPFRKLEDAPVPVHVIATNLGGVSVCISSGPAVEAILASAAIPAAFPHVRIDGVYLMDGCVGANTPIVAAAKLGATRIIALPTGFACALHEPPKGVIARALHTLTLLIAQQMVRDLEGLAGKVDVFTVPSLCPLDASPHDFSSAKELIERAAATTRQWIDDGGLSRPEIPGPLLPHTH